MRKGCECRGRILPLFGISLLILLAQPLIIHSHVILTQGETNQIKTFSHSSNPHDPISISSDDDFEKLGFEGNGTEANPYLIKDLSIEAADAVGSVCISVISTSVYFVIQNCELFSKDDKTGTGVYFEKIVNGAVIGCNIHSLSIGLSVLKSERCVFEQNVFSGLGKGMYQSQSIWISIDNNTVTQSGYGLHLNKMQYSKVEGNFIDLCSYGILIENGVEILTKSNQIEGAFFGLYFHNSLRGSSFRNMIRNSQYGVYVAYSKECNISFSEMVENKYGVALLEVDQGVISSSLIRANSEYGIHLKNTQDVEIISNTVFDNSRVGVYLLGVSGAVVHQNEIGFNGGSNAADFIGTASKGLLNNWDTNAWSDYGGTSNYRISGDRGSSDNDPHYILYLEPTTDLVMEAPATGCVNWTCSAFRPSHYSIFINGREIEQGDWNGLNVSSVFMSVDPGSYNYALSLTTESGISTSDNMILIVEDTTAPEWIQIPEDQLIECGSPISYQLNATDYYGIARWWVNDTDFSVEAGLLQNISVLDYGVYNLEVRAYDPSDNYISERIRIYVIDRALPSVGSPEDITFYQGETGNIIIWNVFDFNPHVYEILRDGVSVEYGEWTTEMTIIQYSLDGLSSGTYIFSIILTDIAGNTISDDVQVVVEEPLITEPTTNTGPPSTSTTIPATESLTPTDGEMAIPSMMTMVLIGISASVVLAIVIIVFKRK